MLSLTPKSKATSIWSFDSGYGSATLDDDEGFQIDQLEGSSVYGTLSPSTQQRDQLNLGDSFNPEAEDEVRLRAITTSTEPQATELDVFTTKVCSSNEPLFATRNDDLDCFRSQLWNITNPGESLRCDDCTSEAFVTPEAIVRTAEQPKTTTIAHRLHNPSGPLSKSFSQLKGFERCSACEISALIDPDQPTNCTSCTPNTGFSLPSLSSQPSKVKRSCARRPPTKLESQATRCLQGWLKDNRNNPYPDTETKRLLAEKCGITEKQVSTWFTNARARGRIVDASSSNPASEDEESRRTRPSSVASTAMSYGTSCDRCGPVASHYPAEGASQTGTHTSRRGKKKDYGQSSNAPYVAHRASPVSPTSKSVSRNNGDGESQTWQCTFCYQHIARKSWRRHEETQHRPKRKWTCLLTGPSITLPYLSETSMFCVFCMVSNPSDEHFAQCHRLAECMSKSEDERTFLRPDHLRQHVENFHKAKLDETVRDLWRREGPGDNAVENWVCGFCAKVLRTWEDREKHIAGHFRDGLTMTNWKGCARQDAEAEASRKRPTSSEGRTNMLSKLARTLTGRSVRQQHHCESHGQVADTVDAIPTSMHTSGLELPFLPELVFDDFMPGGGDGYFDYHDTTLKSAFEQDATSAEHHDSAFPPMGIIPGSTLVAWRTVSPARKFRIRVRLGFGISRWNDNRSFQPSTGLSKA